MADILSSVKEIVSGSKTYPELQLQSDTVSLALKLPIEEYSNPDLKVTVTVFISDGENWTYLISIDYQGCEGGAELVKENSNPITIYTSSGIEGKQIKTKIETSLPVECEVILSEGK